MMFGTCAVQLRNPDGAPDAHRRWWGYEGGAAMSAASFAVVTSSLAGLRQQPRIGDAASVDLYVDAPQPLACLTVRCLPLVPGPLLVGIECAAAANLVC
jgi:hypothetical protein